MDSTDFERLLSRLPEIAEVVNQFSSEEIQRQAFDLLASRLGVPGNARVAVGSKTGVGQRNQPAAPRRKTRKSGAATEARSTKPKVVPDLNLRPSGKKSLREFVQEKNPKDNQERFAVIGYYLTEVLELPFFNRDHVFTAFRDIGEKVPTSIDMALRKTAERKSWLDTSNINAVTLTIPGSNEVSHDMPRKPKGK